ncbi:RNA recognition motif domain-containing protein [Hirschfeldia incana]|nr:RNA recognition motif domain-containing protein [Hirschfeldia incana]KAJ0241465.1 RNA recognition motif domain-containing protein [Hirschfeldia incana]
MAYLLPNGPRKCSEFRKCACCFARVNDDGSDTIGSRRPKLPPQRPSVLCNDDVLMRRGERACRIFNKERERAWRFCYWASGAKLPSFTTELPWTSGANSQNINTGILEEVDGSLEPPEDKSIKALVIHGLKDSRILEQNIIDKFAAYGVIKYVSFFAEDSCALVTYTTREGAEKAAQALSKCLFINGQRLKLAWASLHDHEPLMNHRPSAMDPEAVISTLDVGGSSTAASSSNVPIICQYCRATAAALEKESDTREMTVRLKMIDHYQCPFLHVNQNTSAHLYVTQDSVKPRPLRSKNQ